MFDVSKALHAWSFSALTVFTWAGNPNKPTVCPTKRPGIHQEWWSNLWQSGFRSYLCAHLTFGDQVREWRQDTADHCLRLKIRTSMTEALVGILTAFIEVRRVFIVFCSGGLAYKWQWRIGYKKQSTIFHNIYCQSCRCYVSWLCLMLHYQRRTGIA